MQSTMQTIEHKTTDTIGATTATMISLAADVSSSNVGVDDTLALNTIDGEVVRMDNLEA